MKYDLHIHTTFSDGDYTPQEIMELAAKKGLCGIAITDHDECRGYGDLLYGSKPEIRIYPGIELAAKFAGEVHVLGLGIDWQDTDLLRHIDKTMKSRKLRAAKMLRKLRDAGINLTFNEIENECLGNVIGRPHFAAALVKKGYAQTHKEAFSRFLASHVSFYVPFEKISIEQAAKLVTGAGGKAVLAHPGFIKADVLNVLAPRLLGMGFWGIEAYHPTHTNVQCIEYELLAKRLGLYVTAGSDFHGSVKPRISIGQEQRGGRFLEESMKILSSD
ncbi:MAG: PHP domain-containing protein [Christensenellales bacterium]|jgi:predicted metal-dependent phosphoesterase TrpH